MPEVRPETGPMLGLNTGNVGQGRDILFRVDDDAIFQGLAHATGLCFPGYQPHIVAELEPNRQGAALILLRAELFDDLAKSLAKLRADLPGVAIGVIVSRPAAAAELMQAIMVQNLAQGVLPLNLPLRVWLASVWMLLNGGRYMPPELWAARQVVSVHEAAMQRAVGEEVHNALGNSENDGGEALTQREQEVLAFLRKGFQNKIIAARMDLSEHTVKVHVHNIIRKLGVNNRTQASNFFRNGNGSQSDK